MAEDDKKGAELNGVELEEVAGGVEPGDNGWPCPNCGSTNTAFGACETTPDGKLQFDYECYSCWQDFGVVV